MTLTFCTFTWTKKKKKNNPGKKTSNILISDLWVFLLLSLYMMLHLTVSITINCNKGSCVGNMLMRFTPATGNRGFPDQDQGSQGPRWRVE